MLKTKFGIPGLRTANASRDIRKWGTIVLRLTNARKTKSWILSLGSAFAKLDLNILMENAQHQPNVAKMRYGISGVKSVSAKTSFTESMENALQFLIVDETKFGALRRKVALAKGDMS